MSKHFLRTMVVGLLVAPLLLLLGCPGGMLSPPDGRMSQESPKVAGPSSSSFEKQLLEIAQSYESFGRTNQEVRMTGVLCDFNPSRFISGVTPVGTFTPDRRQVAVSSSDDPATHGKKLYYLFFKHPTSETDNSSPIGQAVVKEAWVPEEVSDDGKPQEVVVRKSKYRQGKQWVEQEERFLPYVRKDGRLYHAAKEAGLFILFKVDPKTPGTDEGWVYGTVTADRKQVVSVGRIESCIECHRQAPYDRLFTINKK